jgi:hypothetical protein
MTQQDLEMRVAALEAILARDGITICPACGGSMRESPRFSGVFYCQQDHGHCGEWILRHVEGGRRNGDWPKTAFVRTIVRAGKVDRFRDRDIFRRVLYVAGREVDADPADNGHEE